MLTDSAGRVAHVFLAGQQAYGRWSGNGLRGSLPPELGDLSALVALILAGNDLTGPLPPELGNLRKLEVLGLDDNSLTGPLPPELGGLESLLQLWLQGNNLTGSIPVELALLSALQSLALYNNELTGSVPAELGSLRALHALRLDGNGLTGSIPPELGNLSNLERLDLDNNKLTGPVPSELGGLASLQALFLNGNDLSGPIPAQLGSLRALQILWLDRNNLTGPIPSELGNLSNLSSLYLDRNSLTGPIPSDLGGLAALEWLDLGDNELTGPIPAEIGGLGALRFLWLDGNQLTGPLPAVALGQLANLEELLLDNNRFTGPVPSEIGGLSSLRHLSLAHNADMAGPVPVELAALTRLEKLVAAGTGLCVPSDPGLLAWLEEVPLRRIALCEELDPPMAYLTQAVQSREFPVPLVAGEEALLRVFPTAERATAETIPAVRAHFYVNGGPATVVDIPPGSAEIPVSMDEGDLTKSANAVIPGDLVQPGLEMVVQIDPDGTTDPELGVRRRIPRTGRLQVDVQAVPALDLTLIPFVFETHPDSSLVELVEEVAADPADHAMLEYTRMLLPVGDLNVTVHQPVRTRAKRVLELVIETAIIRVIEGRAGHYQGLMPLPLRGFHSGAYVPGRSSVAVARPRTVALALGSNFGFDLAPCGRENADPAFPYADGSIGAWGYDRRVGRLLPPSTPALMGDCDPPFWVSDYNFANGLRFRASEFDRPTLFDRTRGTGTLLLSGGVDEDGMPFLEPAFLVDAPAALPEAPGDHRITGLSADGAELFSLSFDMSRIQGGDGSAFAFAVPVETSWVGTLASITLSGRGRTVTIDADGDRATVILRDSRTGQVRGVLRDLPDTIATPADAVNALSPTPGVEVFLSRGIPREDAWRR